MLWIGDSLKSKLRIGIFLSLAFHLNIKADQINDGLLAMLKGANADDNEKKMSYSIKPSALNIGIDIFTPSYRYIRYGTSFHNYDLHTSIDFNRIFLDIDFGVLRYHQKQPYILPEKFRPYKNAGERPTHYDDSAFGINGKIGFTYNFLHKNENHNAVFAGFGYNLAFCKDRVSGHVVCWDAENAISPNKVETGVQSFFVQWFDIVLGLRVSVSKIFYLGHTTHVNILKSFIRGNDNSLIPYFISGYGPEENSFNFKFDFYLGVNIPLYGDPKFATKR